MRHQINIKPTRTEYPAWLAAAEAMGFIDEVGRPMWSALFRTAMRGMLERKGLPTAATPPEGAGEEND